MEDITDAFRNKSEICGLTPDEEVKGDVEELAAVLGDGFPAIGDPDVGFLAQVRTPVGVVLEEFLTELAQNDAVEDVDIVRGRGEAHLGVGEVKDEVLPLVPNVVVLEAEEEGEPVQ